MGKRAVKSTRESSSDPVLKKFPTLADFQEYVRNLEKTRGFKKQSVLEKCLILGEEVGELFKAIRKRERIKIDKKTSKFNEAPEELVDIFILIVVIANRLNIDLEKVFRKKEEKNKQRIWE